MVFVFVGLGNPGDTYSRTRHNVGFMAIDAMVRRYAFSSFQKKYKGDIASGRIGTQKIIAVKPHTFMNKSGECVSQVVHFYKVPPENVVVFYDELDLPIGKVRVKIGGGNGGHNGLRSLEAYMDKNYVRVRIGIDHPGDKHRVTGHVLGALQADEQHIINRVTADIADCIDTLIAGDFGAFMNTLTVRRQ